MIAATPVLKVFTAALVRSGYRTVSPLSVMMVSEDAARAARIGAESLPPMLDAFGIDDDFMHLWPPMMKAAISAGDIDLALRLLEPVTTAQPGLVAPVLTAYLHRFLGLIGAARRDNPTEVEAELRQAIQVFEDFGAIPARAHTQAELGQWLM